jgi:hypothetical protein
MLILQMGDVDWQVELGISLFMVMRSGMVYQSNMCEMPTFMLEAPTMV